LRWKRVGSPEARPLRLAGDLILRRFMLPSPVAAMLGKRIAFFSDLHFHDTEVERRRLAALAAAFRELRPEILLTGGDLTGDACDLPLLEAALRQIADSVPRALAIPGNWERGKRWLTIDFWRDVYARGGFELLCNEERDCGVFSVYGGDDLVHGDPKLPPAQTTEGKTRILLTHRPDAVISCDCAGRLSQFSLALCGHTHGGQWRLPQLGAVFVPSFYDRRFDRGWFRRGGDGMPMFVSSGLGELSLPWRFNCRREAVVIDFV